MLRLLDLPEELLCQIAEHLSAEDLFRYGSCCSRVFLALRMNRCLWKKRCEEEWWSIERAYNQIPRFFSKECDDESRETCPMEYFAERKREEVNFRKDVRRMMEIGFSEEYWTIFYRATENYQLIPSIIKYDQKYPIKSLDVEGKIYTAFLSTVRHRLVFQTMERFNELVEEVQSYENELILPLSAMDASFFHVVHYRTKFYQECYALLQKRYPNSLKLRSLPHTLIVKKLVEVLIIVLKRTFIGKTHPNEYFTENFLLSRIYTGEFEPHPLLFCCILQELAKNFNIKMSFANSMMIIHDPSIVGMKSFLIIKKRPAFEYQFFTRSGFINVLTSNGYSSERAQNVEFARATKLKMGKHIFRDYFLHLLSCQPSTIHRYSNLFNHVDCFEQEFPVCKYGINLEEFKYFNSFWHLINRSLRPPDLQSNDIMKTKFMKVMYNQYPEDLNTTLEILKNDDSIAKEFMSTSLKKYLSTVFPMPLTNGPFVGRFALISSSQQPQLVVNHLHVNSQEVIQLLNMDGSFQYVYPQDITSFAEYRYGNNTLCQFFTHTKSIRTDFLFREVCSETGLVTLEPLPDVYQAYL